MAHEILIVDDEPDIRMLVDGILRDEGYDTRQAGRFGRDHRGVPHAAAVARSFWTSGCRARKLDGLGILQTLHGEEPHVPVVMISGHGTIETAVAAIQQYGAYDFIEKPFQSDRLLLVVRRALEASNLARENAELKLRAGTENELTGESSALSMLRAAVEKVAPTGSRVLITGPAGSGKEVVTRMIHARSRRADGPFVALNCATLNPARFEEELFGVEGGSDPVSQPRRAGVLERAHGGTLLLDEVSDMPLETQGKIVRALQDQTFERLGGSTRVKVDIRVLSLHEQGFAGRDRGRAVPRGPVLPARCRAAESARAQGPARTTCRCWRAISSRVRPSLSGIPNRELSTDALTALQSYDWPGNVRQLRNLMDWLLIMAPGGASDPIRAEMLPPEIGSGAPALFNADPSADIMALPLREARDVFETQYLQAQLVRFGGNISRTAGFVGMERSALHRKLKQLGISSEDRASG